MGKKKSKGGNSGGGKGCFSTLLIVVLLLIVVIAAGALTLMFVPEKYIPAPLQGVRESLLSLIGKKKDETIPVPLIRHYQARYDIKTSGGPEFTVCFAPSGPIAEELIRFIQGAKSSLYLCIHHLGSEEAAKALEAAKKREVDVQIVTDSDFRKEALLDRLAKCGIPVIEDKRPGVMGQKFMVRDARDVWTGSCDFTAQDIRKNDEDVIIFQSPHAASLYLAKFSEYQNGCFGERAGAKTVKGRFLAGKVPMQILFAPADPVCSEVVKRISDAKKSIRFMASNPESEMIIRALTAAVKRGVSVECLVDQSRTSGRFFRNDYIRGCGIKIHAAANENGRMNHNAMILDDEVVMTGSCSFTESSEKYNDENLVIIADKSLAKCYTDEFNRCVSGGKNY